MNRRHFFAASGLCLTLFLAGCASGTSKELPSATPTQIPTLVPTATPTPAADAGKLDAYITFVKNYNFKRYANPEIIDEPLQRAEELIASGTATQEDYDMALQTLKDTMNMLHDGSGLPAPELLKKSAGKQSRI